MDRTVRFNTRTLSHDDTVALGVALGERLGDGLCVALSGPLGAGKTTMVAGLCRGLGVSDQVQSPTFILYEEFQGRHCVVHIDLYRLEHENEIEELGVFDLPGNDAVLLAEWGERSPALLAQADVVIEIEHETDTARKVTVTCTEALGPTLQDMTQWS